MNSRRSFLGSLLAAALTPALRFLPASKVEPSVALMSSRQYFGARVDSANIVGYRTGGVYHITSIVVWGDSQFRSFFKPDMPIVVDNLRPETIAKFFRFSPPIKEG